MLYRFVILLVALLSVTTIMAMPAGNTPAELHQQVQDADRASQQASPAHKQRALDDDIKINNDHEPLMRRYHQTESPTAQAGQCQQTDELEQKIRSAKSS